MKQVILKLNIAFMVSLSLMMGACTDFPDDLVYDVKISNLKIKTKKSDYNLSKDAMTYGLEVSANIYTDFVNEEVKEAYIYASSAYWSKKIDFRSQLKSNGGKVTVYIDGIPVNYTIYYKAVINGNFCHEESDRINDIFSLSDLPKATTGRAEVQASSATLYAECSDAKYLDGTIKIEIQNKETLQQQAVKNTSSYSFKVTILEPNKTYQYRAIYQSKNGTISYGELKSFKTKAGTSPEAVDLGLSVKWAAWNIGANTPIGYGDYYAWGETSTKSSYTESNYTYYANPSTLPLSNDVAHVKWGGTWRMPTKSEFEELKNNCNKTFTTISGVYGCKVTSKKNGNSIFLPGAGYRWDGNLSYVGSRGYYWSSSLRSNDYDYAYGLYFYSGDWYWNGLYRSYGWSVRAVCP